MKKILLAILRIGITLALLIFLFNRTDFKSLFGLLRASDRLKMIGAFSTFFLLHILVVLRWRLLLKGLDIKILTSRLFLSYISSQFFNLILPSTIGGDAIKALDVAHCTKSPSSRILATVLLDRFTGFLGLMTVLIFALLFGYKVLNDSSILLVGLILSLIVLLLAAVMFSDRVFDWMFRWLPFKRLKEYLCKIHEATASYNRKRRFLVGAWLLSIPMQAGIAVVYYFVAQAIGVRMNLIYFLIFVPVITAFSVIPISIAGLGVRDTASVALFAKVGLGAEKAFALSLCNFGFMFIFGILGGFFYVFTISHRRIQSD